MGKHRFSWLFKHDDEVNTFHYCTIEEYDENGYVISIPARYFIKTVRSLIKTAKARLEHGDAPDNLGVKVIFREQMCRKWAKWPLAISNILFRNII